jgi:hypothetical protein
LSYEGKEKADVLNKYFCWITNLVDENKTLPDFDDRGGNVLCKWLKMFLNTIFSNILLTQDNNETGL